MVQGSNHAKFQLVGHIKTPFLQIEFSTSYKKTTGSRQPFCQNGLFVMNLTLTEQIIFPEGEVSFYF